MSIFINHRFLDRLSPENISHDVRYIIIGTFNPGSPDDLQLSVEEKKEFDKISSVDYFKEKDEIENFYDRSNNRFWGVMDRLAYHDYNTAKWKKENREGELKYYKGMKREIISDNQKSFCEKHGILVTDIIKRIKPIHFKGIYTNYEDKTIDSAAVDWNTDFLTAVIKDLKPEKVFSTFQFNNNSTPNISSKLKKIETDTSRKIIPLLSPSGSARKSYPKLVADWSQHISLNNLS